MRCPRTIPTMRGKKASAAAGVSASDSTRRSNITDVQVEEAAALKRLFVAYKSAKAKDGVKITQSAFALEHGIATDPASAQGLFWQYLNARIPLNLRVALRFAEGLGCKLKDFSPRLAKEQAELAGAKPAGPKTYLQSMLELKPLEVQLLGMYRELDADQQQELHRLANDMHAKKHPEASPANPFGQTKKKPTKSKEDVER
jgi:hypothetical protein